MHAQQTFVIGEHEDRLFRIEQVRGLLGRVAQDLRQRRRVGEASTQLRQTFEALFIDWEALRGSES